MKYSDKLSNIIERWKEIIFIFYVKWMTFFVLWRPGRDVHIYDIQKLTVGGGDTKNYTAYINNQKVLMKVIPKRKWRDYVDAFYILREQNDLPIAYGSLHFNKRFKRLALYIRPWMEGKTLRNSLLDLDESAQYDLGKRVVENITAFHRVQTNSHYLDTLEEHLKELLDICRNGELDLYGYAQEILSHVEEGVNRVANRPAALLHCDLNPNNIIIDAEGNPLLIDFDRLRRGDPLWDWAYFLKYHYFPKRYDHKAFCMGVIDQLEKEYSEDIWDILAMYRAILLMSPVERSGNYTNMLRNPNVWKRIYEDLINPMRLRATLSRQNAKMKKAAIINEKTSDEPLVSVIVPVWNPGPGISKCIESLRKQTLEEIEMIFVDDCGSDDSMDQVYAAAGDDPRIRILKNEENMGPGSSRNKGIGEARGEYLSFVDADDYVALDFLEKLYEEACILSSDVVKGVVATEGESGLELSQNNRRIHSGIISNKPLYRLFSYEHTSAIYRREFVVSSNIKYGHSRRGEETTFLLQVTSQANSFIMVETAYYHRCLREESTLHILDQDQLDYCADAISEQIDCVLSLLPGDENAESYLRDRFLYYLEEYERYDRIPDMKMAAEQYLNRLRKELIRVPYCDKLAEHSYPMRVLRDYGIGLPIKPSYSPFTENQDYSYLSLLNRWLDFYMEHPLEREVCKKYIARIQAGARQANTQTSSQLPSEESI